jgi:glutaredoxin
VIGLTLYSRPGCHLCDEMKATVNRVVRATTTPVSVSEIDISSDPDLERRYGLEIPVLTMNGRKVAKYRVTEQQLTRILQGPE